MAEPAGTRGRPGLLEGKRALIAGVANAQSIAWGIAEAFRDEGARLAFTCVEMTRRRVGKLAAEMGVESVLVCDVASDDDIARAVGEAGAAFGGAFDVLVHAIAYAPPDELRGGLVDVSRGGWAQALDISAYSLVSMARAARPFLRAAGGGCVITLTYEGGPRVTPGYELMGVAKAALETVVRYLAYDLGPDGIRVNALSPGPIRTASASAVKTLGHLMSGLRSQAPLLRPITQRDVGDMAVLCASGLFGGVTGATIPVDSGVSILVPAAATHPRATPPTGTMA